MVLLEGFDKLFNLAVEDSGQVVHCQADAVVGEPILGEVVSANLLAAVSAFDLLAALAPDVSVPAHWPPARRVDRNLAPVTEEALADGMAERS